MTALAPTLQAFFTSRLIGQRGASPNTIAGYRDTWRLLLDFAARRTGKNPCQLDIADLDAPLITAFLDHLEQDRGNSPRTRNNRLAAIRSLFAWAALRHPEHAASIQRVLAIPPKRYQRNLVTYLTGAETGALAAACDKGTWTGRRDHALIVLAAQAGLRISELAALTAGDIILGAGAHVHRLKATIYYLLAPLVVSRMIERRLTLVDLGLDARIHTEFMLAQAICRSLSDEFRIAQIDPMLPYSPYVQGWREKRQECPQRFRRQGLPLGRLNTALDELLVTRPEGVETLTTFGEFEPLLASLDDDDMRSGPGAARDLFFETDPVTRPVLWRVLVIQVLLYWCFQKVVFGEGLPDPAELEQAFTASEMHARLLVQSRPDAAAVESLGTTTSVAVTYISDRLAPGLRRVQLLAAAPRALPADGNA